MSFKKLLPVAVISIGLALTFTACSEPMPQSVSAAPESIPVAPKQSSTPVRENTFTASGPLVVEHQLDLLAQRDGVISRLAADVGLRVKMGDVLAELDNRQLMADLEAARSKANSADAELKSWQSEDKVLEADYDRAKKLWDAQLIPFEQFEHANTKPKKSTSKSYVPNSHWPPQLQRNNPSHWNWKRPGYVLLSLA